MIPAGVALTLASLLAGWLALAPLSRRLGTLWYHLLAYPVGLLAWVFVLSVAGALARPYDPIIMAVGLVLFSIVGSLLSSVSMIGEAPASAPRLPWWSFILTLGAVGALSALALAFGMSFSTDDSIMAYEVLGVWLHDTGIFTVRLASERSFLVPAIHAANRALGGDWGFAQYPVLAAHVVGILGLAVWDLSADLRRRWRMAIALGTAVLLGSAPAFLFHSFYVHSHMISAASLLVAIVAVLKATSGDLRAPMPQRAWLCVGGFAAAGVALARTDGLAYVFVVLATVCSVYFSSGMSRRDLLAFFGCLFGLLWVPYAVAFAKLGVWASGKLDGSVSLALLALMLAVAFAAAGVGSSALLHRLLGRKSALLTLVLVLDVLAIAGLSLAKSEDFVRTLKNMLGNLARYGGYQSLWYVVLLLVAATVLYRGVSLRSDWLGHVLFVIVQFMAVAVVVHVTKHPGRLSPNDSFNRIAFHVVPVAFLYGGMLVRSLVAGWRRREVAA